MILWIFSIFVVSSCYCWEVVKEERMPKELRFVNEGLTHDENNWFMSNKHFLYKTKKFPLEIELANHNAIPNELVILTYDHIGDIDYLDGIIYGGLEAKKGDLGILARWNSSDLTFIDYKYTTQNGMPWVAIDPSTRLLYSAVWNDVNNLQVYNADDFSFVQQLTVQGANKLPPEVQGGAFYEGDLYIATNIDDGVWKVNVTSGEVTNVLFDTYKHHEYEMEGLSFWDLTSIGYGVMHIFGNFMQVREKCIRSYAP